MVLSAVQPSADGRGILVRVLNASDDAVTATLTPSTPARDVRAVDPLERSLADVLPDARARVREGRVHLPLRPWQIQTVIVG